MARTLDVYLKDDLVGHLVQDNGGQMSFAYGEGWLAKPITSVQAAVRTVNVASSRWSNCTAATFSVRLRHNGSSWP